MHHFIPQENEALLSSEAWLHYRFKLSAWKHQPLKEPGRSRSGGHFRGQPGNKQQNGWRRQGVRETGYVLLGSDIQREMWDFLSMLVLSSSKSGNSGREEKGRQGKLRPSHHWSSLDKLDQESDKI